LSANALLNTLQPDRIKSVVPNLCDKPQMASGEQPLSFVRHAESRHLRMAKTISMVIAHAKQQKEIQLRDLIAGIYVANFERILQFWPDAATFEDFIAEHCDWSEHRLLTWDRWNYELQHPPRTISIPFTSRFYQIPRKHTFTGKLFGVSDELKRVYSTAEQLSPNKVTSFGRVVPLITPELFLVAAVRTDGIELAARLKDSGIELGALEHVAVRQLKEPDKLMF